MSARAIPATGQRLEVSKDSASQTNQSEGARLAIAYSLRSRLTWTVAAMVVTVFIASFRNLAGPDNGVDRGNRRRM